MVTVIVPTLNEAANILHLIDGIYVALGPDALVIVVDDSSTDGTGEIVSKIASERKTVRLIVRSKERGLGSAVRRGAREARDGYIAVMDADLSHNPKYLPEMFSKLDQGYDIVVGSRYIEGGKTEGWPGYRIAISRIATTIARHLLHVKVKDPMSGYVACRDAHFLESGFQHGGFKFLLEMIVRNRNLRAAEVPIVFRDRARGKSKLHGITVMLFVSLVLSLLFNFDLTEKRKA